MKEMIVNALKAKGKPTEGKTEAELLDAYNQMNAEDGKSETEEEKAGHEEKVQALESENASLQTAERSSAGAAVQQPKLLPVPHGAFTECCL